MDKEKRIAELEERERQIKVEKAFYNGKKIEIIIKKWKDDLWSETKKPMFNWSECDYRIAEETRRIPFDGSDAFGLAKCIFKEIDEDYIFHLPLEVGNVGVRFNRNFVNYEDLSENWLKWNDTLQVWQPCNKVA